MITLTPVNPKWEATPDLVGKYINQYLWSDVNPVAKIIAVDGKTKFICHEVYAKENKAEMNYVAGGFSAHCTNQYEQDWEILEDDMNVFTINYSRHYFKKRHYAIADAPRKFYNYNF